MTSITLATLGLVLASAAGAAPKKPAAPAVPAVFDAGVLSGLGGRNIGSAAMSGRVAAVAARVAEDGKVEVFVGAASGGVWKSTDGATTFKPVFDHQAVQSIGAIAIDPSNPKTVWVGSGESWTRNSVSIGDGIYKSTDGGENWKNVGLPESERITKIVVHPKDGNTVYACVPGKLWSDSADRGLYRTSDGGQTWTLVLKGKNLSTGCSAVTLDPKDPQVLLAGMWDFRRKGWTFRSGGEGPDAPSGSGLYRSADGGTTWTELGDATQKGLPPKPWGRVEVEIAPGDAKRVYALIESKASALFVSDDAGQTWEPRDKSQMMVWRPFYFANLIVDPTNPDRVFKVDGGLIVSDDAGRTFNGAGSGHGDWHDLWIDPRNPKHVIAGDDGGLWVSQDGASRWWKVDNLPISQFYHVAVDDRDPYQVYGGLQDNGSWTAPSSFPGSITNRQWDLVYWGDGFAVIPDPGNPDLVYAESQGGYIAQFDRKTRQVRDIQPKAGYKEKLRFNWNAPIHASPNELGTIYLGAQFLFRTRDHGQTWDRISPDLTTNDPEKQKQEESGGVTVDNSSAEMYTTLSTISESRLDPKQIWVGTDDGNIQVTRDGGGHWENVGANLTEVPASRWVSHVEPSRFDRNTAYVTLDRHTFGDMAPHAFKTADGGKTWTRIAGSAQGIRGYAHVIREDTVKPGLLYLGTEFGLWISIDGGARWAAFKGADFPAVAVRDLAVQPREGDLVIATHGRGIWILDDLSPLRDLGAETLAREAAFLGARPTQQRISGMGAWIPGDNNFAGAPAPGGAVLSYYQRKRHLFGPLKLEILDPAGAVIDTIPASKRRGINRVTWAMRVPPPRVPRAAQVAFGASQGPRVLPGTYKARLTKGGEIYEAPIVIGLDRRASYNADDRKAQFEAAMRVHALFGEMSDVVDRIQGIRGRLAEAERTLPAGDALRGRIGEALTKTADMRKKIVATKEGGAITGEERIREHTETLYGAILGYEGRPGVYQVERIDALKRELGDVAKDVDTFASVELAGLDQALKAKGLAGVVSDATGGAGAGKKR